MSFACFFPNGVLGGPTPTDLCMAGARARESQLRNSQTVGVSQQEKTSGGGVLTGSLASTVEPRTLAAFFHAAKKIGGRQGREIKEKINEKLSKFTTTVKRLPGASMEAVKAVKEVCEEKVFTEEVYTNTGKDLDPLLDPDDDGVVPQYRKEKMQCDSPFVSAHGGLLTDLMKIEEELESDKGLKRPLFIGNQSITTDGEVEYPTRYRVTGISEGFPAAYAELAAEYGLEKIKEAKQKGEELPDRFKIIFSPELRREFEEKTGCIPEEVSGGFIAFFGVDSEKAKEHPARILLPKIKGVETEGETSGTAHAAVASGQQPIEIDRVVLVSRRRPIIKTAKAAFDHFLLTGEAKPVKKVNQKDFSLLGQMVRTEDVIHTRMEKRKQQELLARAGILHVNKGPSKLDRKWADRQHVR